MFTGIVEEVGQVERIRRGVNSAQIALKAAVVLEGMKKGDSVAVNGVCLTVTSFHGKGFTADVMPETLDRTALGRLRSGSPVNLERAMAADGRFGGHIVAGHVDGVGTVGRVERDDNAVWYTIYAEAPVLRYIVEKGSVAVDGISLTVAKVGRDSFSVSTIPHTGAVTTLGGRKPGDKVNLETDIIGKYVEKLLGGGDAGGITQAYLARYGF